MCELLRFGVCLCTAYCMPVQLCASKRKEDVLNIHAFWMDGNRSNPTQVDSLLPGGQLMIAP